MLNSFIGQAMLLGALLPDQNDWQRKIDEELVAHFEAKHLPRKQKKAKRKEIMKNVIFYKSLKQYKYF